MIDQNATDSGAPPEANRTSLPLCYKIMVCLGSAGVGGLFGSSRNYWGIVFGAVGGVGVAVLWLICMGKIQKRSTKPRFLYGIALGMVAGVLDTIWLNLTVWALGYDKLYLGLQDYIEFGVVAGGGYGLWCMFLFPLGHAQPTGARVIDQLRMFAAWFGRVPFGQMWMLWRKMRNEKAHRFGGRLRVNSFFPPFPSQAYLRFRDAISAKRRVPVSTYMALTSRCPFECDHCSLAGRGEDELSTDQWLEVISQLKDAGGCIVGFTGGEPLLRDDLERLIEAAGPEMETILFTTGAGLDAARAERLAAAGLGCVTVGIEADSPEAHDAVRGQSGSFDQAKEAIAACQAAGLYTALSTIGTAGRIASGQIDAMYAMSAGWGVQEFRLLAPVATGAQAGNADFMLDLAGRQTLKQFHIDSNRKARSSGAPAVASFAYLESEEMFGCGGGYHHLFVDAGGNVCPCDLTPLSFGSVTENSLADIWASMEEYFPRPGCKCIMSQLAQKIAEGQTLPLHKTTAEELAKQLDPTELPEGYKRIL
jgi:MoaA/NifB/PqqE/SkfB family radical SAM enzyme